jgi:tRNA1Val (adenine37-N6)-methyltransferase
MPFRVHGQLFNIMANQYFSFKQFTVHQDACAMKVCTDACIQGAYTARHVAGRTVMDIGTGTGLLSLMLAQQLPATTITAIELDSNAAAQAAANVAASPWANQISVITTDVKELPVTEPYDFIITNPPFYEADLKSSNQLRNQAMHATTLNYGSLINVMLDHLAPAGSFSILLPYRPFADFNKIAVDKGFYARELLNVRQSEQHDYFRTIGIFTRGTGDTIQKEMSIRSADNTYTAAFTALLKDYYLYL